MNFLATRSVGSSPGTKPDPASLSSFRRHRSSTRRFHTQLDTSCRGSAVRKVASRETSTSTSRRVAKEIPPDRALSGGREANARNQRLRAAGVPCCPRGHRLARGSDALFRFPKPTACGCRSVWPKTEVPIRGAVKEFEQVDDRGLWVELRQQHRRPKAGMAHDWIGPNPIFQGFECPIDPFRVGDGAIEVCR